jgi:HsdM N-terminal domain
MGTQNPLSVGLRAGSPGTLVFLGASLQVYNSVIFGLCLALSPGFRVQNCGLQRTRCATTCDAAEYKHVVLGLLFLKYSSDAFEAKHAELSRTKPRALIPRIPDLQRPIQKLAQDARQ